MRLILRILATVVAAAMLGLAGCGDRDAVRVKLSARPAPDEPATLYEVEAQVSGPLSGLHYKWFCVSGQCNPQETDRPTTSFKFAEGVRQDQVSVEVWRESQRLAQSEIRIKYEEDKTRKAEARQAEVWIEIGEVPPAEQGGPDTSNHIAGIVGGKVPPGAMVAVYTRAFAEWYVQPVPRALHPLHEGNTWNSWLHTGNRYAAILVTSDFEPPSRLGMLPEVKGSVLACAIADGKLTPAKTNAPSVKK
ncbi:MAG TPA: hypothetical protein VMF06_17530 [Candidatus Limnocylindria bacterium]|nr:hypothetical protein [Candidatus Limnocylindria bacterium]